MQKDNIRNQRENVILMIANKQSGLGIPAETDPVSSFMNPFCCSFTIWSMI